MDPYRHQAWNPKGYFCVGSQIRLGKNNHGFREKGGGFGERKVKKVMEKQARIFRSAPGIEG